MTARHPEDNRPHRHHVDPALVALADELAKAHVMACAVCMLARAYAMQRAEELDVLGPLEESLPQARDQFYAETQMLYCGTGQQLMLALGRAVVGVVESG